MKKIEDKMTTRITTQIEKATKEITVMIEKSKSKHIAEKKTMESRIEANKIDATAFPDTSTTKNTPTPCWL